MELTAGGKCFPEGKNQSGIFNRGALSPCQFVIVMMTLNHIHRKCIGRYKLIQSEKMINPLMYMATSNYLPKMKKNWKF